ncbi:hypothetical protein BBK36DRAFT_1114410 [Trichoderma citrinoviride]|uniref:Uncharacterized protein n=1 Tax=Trichoderma citrinoviride TaxID=58853 RepID=A0A2T4BFU7_9HYPO|nr:hypothetical protein BBK36DRAFT_1114410 [Trichoderma citrinoviride]PTB68200.1 hypothetical protein BBK36DRAFT_1114410 [Trichoderma citrinoviride]
MRSSDPFRRVRGCVHTSIEVRLPRPPVLGSDGTLVSPPSTPPPLGLSEAEVAAWHRKRQHEEMQGLQLELWKRGLERFGRLDDAHVFVRALPLAGARSPTSSTSEESDVPFSSLSSPTSTVPKRLSLRAIVHSRSNPPFGLKREFDLDALRETIPEPLPKSLPRLFDREKWLSKVQLASGFRRASWPAATPPPLVKTSVADERKTAESVEPNPSVSAQGIQLMVGVPISEYILLPRSDTASCQ